MSTVAKKIMMGSGAGDSAYKIDQSILLNSPDIPILYRQAAATGNRRTFTYSCWVKRAKEDIKMIVSFGNAADTNAAYLAFYSGSLRVIILNSSVQAQLFTNAVFLDFSSWYHIVLAVDTTQGTAANRLKLYVNGTQITSFSTEVYPSQNYDTAFSLDDNYLAVGNNPYYISDNSYNGGIDGYIAEVHILDGVAKAPSDFGETNEDTGQWIPKEYTGGSYGTNGFYGKFVSGAIGTDSSGTGNTMTVANLANADIVPDSPTNNFATINYLVPTSSTFTEGNLKATMGNGGNGKFVSTIGASSGKFYMEIPWLGVANFGVGIAKTNTAQTYLGSGGNDLQFFLTGSATTLYSSNGVNAWDGSGTGWSNNDMLSLALDATNQIIAVYKNGSSIGSFDYSSLGYQLTFFGGGHSINGIIYLPNFGQNPTHSGTVTAGSATDGNGIGLFKYAPPSGYLSLCTANLPDPAIPLPEEQFNNVLWAGNATDDRAITVGFAPDFTWFKQRTGTNSHGFFDKVRGNSNPNGLSSNSTSAEFDWTGIFKGHTSTGFTVGTDSAVNANSNNYVAWNWKANGSGSTNNDGNQASVVSANQAAGFSIVTYTGTGSYATYGHGLGVIPEVTLTKSRSATGDWYFVTTVIDGSVDYLVLNTTAAAANGSATASTSSVFYSNYPNNETVVAYNFTSIPGYSKIGVYTGNSSTNGPFVNTGFKPALVIRKRVTSTADWFVNDAKINPINSSASGTGLANISLWANTTSADQASGEVAYGLNILSNGFKTTTSRNYLNYVGDVYLYMAFAEAPFKYANAR